MRSSLALLAAVFLLSVFACDAQAGALRCGSRLISPGDPAVKLLHYCGKPDSVSSSHYERRGFFRFGRYFPGFVEDVLVENWTYNFGPDRLMRQIRVVDGIVKDIESLGYGYREADPADGDGS
ncbi:MAG TPA: DUF2845 domain-containing protein [Gammaproteobacteria bacterium]|nr:DUF2845 domain-containing protein [Gammaproteobacteria bacterium]